MQARGSERLEVTGPNADYWRSLLAEAGERDGRLNAAAMPLTGDPALLWRRETGETEPVSARVLSDLAGEISASLKYLGIKPGDRVAGMLGRRSESFALPLAIWRLGAIYVPLFSGFGVDAAKVRLADCDAAMLVVDAANLGTGKSVAEVLPDLKLVGIGAPRADTSDVSAVLEEVRSRAGEVPVPVDTSATDIATIMYTSGTSGSPKGCMVAHYGTVTLWPNVDHALATASGDVLFSTADTGWSYGLYTTGLAPMTRGVTRVIYEGGFEPSAWWETVRELSVNHLAGAPTGYRQLAAAGIGALGELPARLVSATSCGEPLTGEVSAWFKAELGMHVRDSYGLTELGILIADQPGVSGSKSGAMGTALPGFEVELLDDDLRPVPEGEPGRIAVRDHGLLLSRGYWNRMSEWEERCQDGWWVTEDIARRQDGCYWYVGRADDVIVTAGYNVGPTDVETVILEHPQVTDAACVSEPDPRKGHVIAAHVVLSDAGADREDLLRELRDCVGERVGWHAAPRSLHVTDILPRTPSGKVRRKELRA